MNIELVCDCRCELGENPRWDAARGVLLWTDIPRGRVLELDARSAAWRVAHEGDPIGGFTIERDGSLLLFGVDRIDRLAVGGVRATLVRGIDPEMERFNDAIADPEGRAFAGSKGAGGSPAGGLFRIDRDRRVEKLFAGTAIANGMAFSPDLRHFYWTDTSARTIERFAYDRETGALSGRTRLVTVPSDEGVPDGLAIDAEGALWSARYGGSSVVRHDPDGRVIDVIRLPVANVTAVAFGGDALDELYITTATDDGSTSKGEGGLYRCRPAVRGRVDFRSAIG